MTASFGVTLAESPQVYSAFNSFIGTTTLINQSSGDVPKSFLNYIFFDNNYENPEFGFVQVSSAASSAHQKLSLSKTVNLEGYLYVYACPPEECRRACPPELSRKVCPPEANPRRVSNESTLNVDVFFLCLPYPTANVEGGDDLKITNTSPSKVVQANDY